MGVLFTKGSVALSTDDSSYLVSIRLKYVGVSFMKAIACCLLTITVAYIVSENDFWACNSQRQYQAIYGR